MTATNHALTGAVIALAVKKPELAIPLAFLSHFVLDLVPHYNPKNINKQTFISHAESWHKKMAHKTFRLIFISDMTMFVLSLVTIPIAAPSSVSAFTVFFSMALAASPDFFGGLEYVYSLIFGKKPKSTWFDNFHVWLQWKEVPWGIYVELVWLIIMATLVHNLIS